MYKAIQQIRKLRKEKQAVLSRVYQSNDLDMVYENQTALGSMSVSIFTDVANVILPVLQEDGVNNIVWPNISLRLEKLSFINIPTAAEIRAKYKKGVDNPMIVKIDGPAPEPGEKTKVALELPAFLALLAAQGIAVPLILNILGAPKMALVLVDATLMTVEVVAYMGIRSKRQKKGLPTPAEGASAPAVNYEDMYEKAIREVYRDNRKRLDAWFDTLEKITEEEIGKELKKTEG